MANNNSEKNLAVNDDLIHDTWDLRRYNFNVRFSGDGLENHEINAKLLARSIDLIADTIIKANTQENGDSSNISVNVKAGFREGSFIVDFITTMSCIDASYTVDVVKALGLAGVSAIASTEIRPVIDTVIGLYKWLNGNKIEQKKEITTADGRKATIIQSNNKEATVYNGCVFNIAANSEVSKNLLELTKGIDGKSMNKIEFSSTGVGEEREPLELIKEDADIIGNPFNDDIDPVETKTERTDILWLYVTRAITSGERKGWGFGPEEGKNQYSNVTVNDTDFLDKVDNKEIAFRKDTRLKVELKKVQKQTKSGNITTQYTVLKVLDYKSA